MPYTKSAFRCDFDARIGALLHEAKRASSLGGEMRELREMVFQCAVFQASAAMESYLRFVVETWFQQVKANKLGSRLPPSSRARILTKVVGPIFGEGPRDEQIIYKSLSTKSDVWEVMRGADEIPHYMDGTYLHENVAYPSNKNLRRLFVRLGVPNIHTEVSRILKRDAELLIDGFQSVRTAIAHASPGAITLNDVRRLLRDVSAFVRAVDRVLYSHIHRHGGSVCWSSSPAP